jgi:hypothetical protein
MRNDCLKLLAMIVLRNQLGMNKEDTQCLKDEYINLLQKEMDENNLSTYIGCIKDFVASKIYSEEVCDIFANAYEVLKT